MGTGYKGGAPYYHSIAENLPELTNKYKFQKGYFGERGTSSQIRVMVCSDQYSESKAFYDKLAYGGIEKPLEKTLVFMSKQVLKRYDPGKPSRTF